MRLLAKLVASLVILFLVAFGTVLTLLSTDYGLPMTQMAVRTFSPYQLDADALEYDLLSPMTLALTAPALRQDGAHTEFNAEYLSLRLSPLDTLFGTPSFNHVVIRGTALEPHLKSRLPGSLSIQHLALDNVSFRDKQLGFSHADIQLSQWQNSDAPWGTWQGEFLFSAPNADIDGLALSNLLIDSEYRDGKWEVWGLSFASQFGTVTGSATLENGDWLIHQLTVSDARIEQGDGLTQLLAQWQERRHTLNLTLNRLDLLDISLALPALTVEHLNLSAQSVYLKQGKLVWAPDASKSLLSFNANLAHYAPWVLTDVLADVALSPSTIDVAALSAKINDEGFLSVSGIHAKDTLTLKNLIASGLELELSNGLAATLQQQWTQLRNVSIDALSVRHTSVSSPDDAFPVFVSGLNVDGNALVLRKAGQNGMWQGKMTASAASASINRIVLPTPYAAMQVDNGVWQLDPLSLSFLQGQLNASASINLTNPSHPWQLSVSGLGVPDALYRRWLALSLPLNGRHDLELSLSGLGADKDSFAYSLSGKVTAQPLNTQLLAPAGQSLGQSLATAFAANTSMDNFTAQPVKLGEINIQADRGRISLSPVTISQPGQPFSMRGFWDLVTGEGSVSLDKR